MDSVKQARSTEISIMTNHNQTPTNVVNSSLARLTTEILGVNVNLSDEIATKATGSKPLTVERVTNPSDTETQIGFKENRTEYRDALQYVQNLSDCGPNIDETDTITDTDTSDEDDSLDNEDFYINNTVITAYIPHKDTSDNTDGYAYTPQLDIIIYDHRANIDEEALRRTCNSLFEVKNIEWATEHTKYIVETDVAYIDSIKELINLLSISSEDITLAASSLEKTKETTAAQ